MSKKVNDFINGILSLVISQILIKIFGVIYSVYLTNKNGFGDEGNAIYMSGYQIYALLLTISSIGVPNAIAKLISEKNSQKDILNRERIFKIAMILFAMIGIIGTTTLFIFSEFIANQILEIPEANFSLLVLAPAIFFVSVNSVVRGYFNGIGKIKITAKVQFIEQVLKSLLTIVLVEISSEFSNNNTEIMAAFANLATSLATFFSLIYILKEYVKEKNEYQEKMKYPTERIKNIIEKVMIISFPMTLNAILSSIGKNIDSLTVVKFLKNIIGEELAKKKYGIISSKVDILVSMPLSFNAAIATALIPEIARRKAQNDLDGLENKIKFSLLITLILGIPYCFGTYFYSNEIFSILFPNASDGSYLLKLSALGIIFSMITQTINAILQGLGNNKIPVYSSLIGAVCKIFLNIFLLRIECILEKGVIIGNIISSFIAFCISYWNLRKTISIKFNFITSSLKPFLGSCIMIIFSKSIEKILLIKTYKNNIVAIIAIGTAIISYFISIFFMKILKMNEIFENVEKPENRELEKNKTPKSLKNKKKF